jgi:hypothetical protein
MQRGHHLRASLQDGRISTASLRRRERELLGYTSRERGSDQQGPPRPGLAMQFVEASEALPEACVLQLCLQLPYGSAQRLSFARI